MEVVIPKPQNGISERKELDRIVLAKRPSGSSSHANPQKAQKPIVKKIPPKVEPKPVRNGSDFSDHVKRPFSPKSEKYIRKMDRLVKIYEQISEKNTKLKYHLLRVKHETKHLTKVKRTLCSRLSSFKDPFMDQNLEVPDYNQREIDVDNLIADVITSTEPLVAPTSKRKKVEPKRAVKKDESKEQDSKKEVINRILSAASSVMQQEEQKGALKKLEAEKASTSKPSTSTTTSAPVVDRASQPPVAQKQIITVPTTIYNAVQNQGQMQNVYLITTPLPGMNPTIVQHQQPVNQNQQAAVTQKFETSPRKTNQYTSNIQTTQIAPKPVEFKQPNVTQGSAPSTSASPNKPNTKLSTSYAVVTHHDLGKRAVPADNAKPVTPNKSQGSGVFIRPASPLHAQITSTPLPPKTAFVKQGGEKPQHSDTMNTYYTQKPITIYPDPTTVNPQLLPHRQMHARKAQEEYMREEREKARRLQQEQGKRLESEPTTMIIAPQQQMIVNRQGQMQHIIIPSSGFQQLPIIQSQPRLREALQNAGNEVQRQTINPQQIQVVQAVVSNQSRIVGQKNAAGQGVTQTSTSQMFVDDARGIIYIDPSRLQYGTRNDIGQVVLPINMGSQTVRYIVPQGSMSQAITISPQKAQKSNYEKLLRASSIDHLLPQNPEPDPNNDDNIDWSKYDEPKPKTKKSSPRKRGVAMKLDANSDAMARISPILAKFQQEMAQSTAAQEQQQQQQLAMAARNATKTIPARARKRPLKATAPPPTSTPVSVSAAASIPSTSTATTTAADVVFARPELPCSIARTQTVNVVTPAGTSSPTATTPTQPGPPQRTRVVFEDNQEVIVCEDKSAESADRPNLPKITVTAATPEPPTSTPTPKEPEQKASPVIVTTVV